jgi:hypothetical protein
MKAAGISVCSLVFLIVICVDGWHEVFAGDTKVTKAKDVEDRQARNERAEEKKAALVKFAKPYKGQLSVSASELGLGVIKREAALVYYKKSKKQLAKEVASVLNKEHLLVCKIVGAAVRVHGVVLVQDWSEIETKLSKSNWANVDNVPCLIRGVVENSLPFKNDLDSFMLFGLMIHESVDMGIKEELLGEIGWNASNRWWVEGIADYCAWQACTAYQGKTCERIKRGYLEGLGKITASHLDLVNEETWWPKGSDGKPESVDYAYACAFYVISMVSERHGDRWIGETLVEIRKEDKKGNTTNSDFCRIAKEKTGEDIEALVRSVEVAVVKTYIEKLRG